MVLVRQTRGKAARMNEAVSNKTIICLMININGVMFLFGLTWLFAILTFSVTGLRETFQILFTFFNSFQGFFIFLFCCVLNKEALESWKEFLSCGRYQSKLLHPSQATSAAARKPKKTNTDGTGLSSSSGGKYAFETEMSNYESATLTKGNIYEKSPLESKVDLAVDTTHTLKGTPEPDQAGAAAQGVTVDQIDLTDSIPYQNGSTNAGEREEERRNKKKTTSLKARIKRYSTKKVSKHHVEVVEVDFHSDNSSHESSDEEDAVTQV